MAGERKKLSDEQLANEIREAVLAPKRGSSTAHDEPKVGIKRTGRIHLNRPAAEVFRLGNHQWVQFWLNPDLGRLYLKSTTEDGPHAHKILFNKGRVPGVVTAKNGLEQLGFDLSRNWELMTATPHQFKKLCRSGRDDEPTFRPGDVVLTVEVPKHCLRASDTIKNPVGSTERPTSDR